MWLEFRRLKVIKKKCGKNIDNRVYWFFVINDFRIIDKMLLKNIYRIINYY